MPFIIEYNRRRAISYANRWALSRNPAYYDFSEIGGDCTNFVSQCLYAGSRVMNYTPETGWYYISVNERSPSWTGVEFLYQFLVNNKVRGPFGANIPVSDVRAGDVIQLWNGERFYHTLFVVSVGSAPAPENILVNAHTLNAERRPLSTYNYKDLRAIGILGVYI